MRALEDHLTSSAFPSPDDATYGLTKREYFVAAAMQGLLAGVGTSPTTPDLIAIKAVEMADAAFAAIISRGDIPYER